MPHPPDQPDTPPASNGESRTAATSEPPPKTASIVARGSLGGALMGIANLVPGISGGTMLLASGIYPRFVEAVAEVTTFRLRRHALVTLAVVAGAAALAIVLLAGPVVDLVVRHTWVMYSLFIGLTLGGVPAIWRMAQRRGTPFWIGSAAGLFAMVLLATTRIESDGAEGHNYLLLTLAGLAGASAMILPGVSGGYLLLILGQYVPILSAIDRARDAATERDIAGLMAEMHVFVPVGLGVLIGIVGISNLVRWLLTHHARPTLGVLLGLLIGAVVGLWPFQQPIEPILDSTVIKGQIVTAENIEQFEPADYPREFFTPSAIQAIGSLAMALIGFLITAAIAHFGRERPAKHESAAPASDT